MRTDRAGLEAELKRLRDEVEDLKETLSFDYTHTSAHIGGGQVRKDEETLGGLKDEIARVERLLGSLDPPEAAGDAGAGVGVIEYEDENGAVLYAQRHEGLLPVGRIESGDAFKEGCGACKKYGKNLSCPPYSPGFGELAGGMDTARVICFRTPLQQFMAGSMEERYRAAFRVVRGLVVKELLSARGEGRVVAGSGACLACGDQCAIELGDKECERPDERIYSLESLGVNVIALSKDALGISLQWSTGGTAAEFVSALGAIFLPI